jgi:hypothetical protein
MRKVIWVSRPDSTLSDQLNAWFTGMEDYSEYESVDENEAEQETKDTKGDKDSSNKGGSKNRQSSERAPSKNKPLKKGQASLVNFFVTPKTGAK